MEKREKKKKNKDKNRGMVGEKREMESKKDDFAFTILGSFFKSGMGRFSKSMEQYTDIIQPRKIMKSVPKGLMKRRD